MTQFQRRDLYSSNYPLLARDFENGLGALSSAFDDEDLIPILDREDDSDLSRPDSSRCSSLSIPFSEWVCPLKESLSSCNHIIGNVAYQLPRAPPPTPLLMSPSFLPRCQNELHLEVPPLDLSTSLAELGVCAAMGNPVFIRRPSWDFNVEENLNCNVEQISKSIPESWAPLCAFCDLPGSHQYSQTTFDDQKRAFKFQGEVSTEEHRVLEPQLYQFPSLTYDHPCRTPSTPPPSICSEGSLDDDQEEITWHSFLRQPYSMVEIDYQLQLLSIQQQENDEETELQVDLESPEIEQPKEKMRLGNKSLSSVEKASGTLKRRISRAIKRSLSR